MLFSPFTRRPIMSLHTLFGPGKLSGLWMAMLAVLLCAMLPQTVAAQDNADESVSVSGGLLYYIGFPDTVGNTYDARYPHQLLNSSAFKLMIYSPVEQQVKIGRANGAGDQVLVRAGEILDYDLKNIGVPIITVVNAPQTNVIKLEAEYPVVVYAYMGTAFGMAAFTPLPVESWGMEYYAATWPGEVVRDVFPAGEFNYGTKPKEGPAEILIVAAYDNTQVVIESTATLRECRGCNTVMLNAGEAYLVESIVDTARNVLAQGDLAGTQIKANKPIGVLSGNTRLMHYSGVRPSLGENSFKDLTAEWLVPTEQHGTEFVFTPTWDDRHVRPGLSLEEARTSEFVRILGTQEIGLTEVSWIDESGNEQPATENSIRAGEFAEEVIDDIDDRTFIGLQARVFRTSRPAYAVMSPSSVVKFNGTTTWGQNYVGASYAAWSTYMVELTPKERWTSFAPVLVPSWPPTGMNHYLNIVTDSANVNAILIRQEGAPPTLVNFDHGKVPGSHYVWGTIALNAGIGYTIYGINGATFTGHVYGGWKGNEQYRPGGTKKDDDGKGASSTGGGADGDAMVLHPSEYEEDISLYYGYPLPALRCAPGNEDEYRIETESNCGEMLIRITALNNNPAGIRHLALLPDSSDNVMVEFIEPQDPRDLIGQDGATLRVRPINPRRQARGVLILKDRTCSSKRWRIEYSNEGLDYAEPVPSNGLDFGKVTVNEDSEELPVIFTNPLGRSIEVQKLSLLLGTQEFRIVRTDPDFDWQSGQDKLLLKPGEKLTVWLQVSPKSANQVYHDSLVVHLGCEQSVSVGLTAQTVEACIVVHDLDFGDVPIGQRKVLPLQICNQGGADVTFKDPYLTWLSNEFSIEQSDLDRLSGTVLKPGDCINIDVAFVSEIPGNARTYARVWANTRSCRDTSIWKARVVDTVITGVAGEVVHAGYEMSGLTPNPTSGKSTLTFRLGRSGQAVIRVFDTEGRVVATLADERMSEGEHRLEWDGSEYTAGTYYIRVESGGWTGTLRLMKVQ